MNKQIVLELIDSHAHIYLEDFSKDIDKVVDRAKEAGVSAIYMPNIDLTTVEPMLELANRYPQYCLPMIGLHPCSVDKEFEKQLYRIEDWISKEQFVAIGEMGTDLHWDKTFWEQQKEAFKIQIEWAKALLIPFVIHCRSSIRETIDLITPMNDDNLKGVFHCFTGTLEEGMEITNLGFKLGIGGVSTFKNGGLDEVLGSVALEHIVLETDSPYLAPAPHRGKRNEPSFLSYIVSKIAEIKSIFPADVGSITSKNARTLFTNRSE